MATAWMIRNDGTAFPCVCHTYGDPDVRGIEETLAAAQWLYEHTAKSATRALCMELIYTWAMQFSMDNADITQIINKVIESRPYRFLSKNFVTSHAGEIHGSCWERSLAVMNEEVNLELNQEFLRARYGGLYDTDPGSHEMFFRISSVAFDWYPIIWAFVEKSVLPIQSVTIVRDAESTGGENRPYRTLNGQGVYHKYPLHDFLAERDEPAAKGKRLTAAIPAAPVTKAVMEGLSAGNSLWKLHDLPINFERLKQKVKWHSRQELKLTEEAAVRMKGRKLMHRLFPSREMADYLDGQELSAEKLNEIIDGAPVPLREKLEIFQSLAESGNDLFSLSAHRTSEAICSLNTKPGEFFYVKSCWPDYEVGEVDVDPMEPYSDLDSAMRGIQLFLEEEECTEDSCYWFMLEKWVLNESGQYLCPYFYVAANGEILYFQKNKNGKDVFYSNIFSKSASLNLPIPFHPGDIVRLDCAPFAFQANAVLLEVGNNSGCCCVQAMFRKENGNWSVGSLKHSHVFPKFYTPLLSPLYRLSTVHGALDDDERILKEVSEFVAGSDERGAALYNEISCTYNLDAAESEVRRMIERQT